MRLPKGLPELKGRWLIGYKGLWWTVLALALTGISYGSWADYRWGHAVDAATYGAGVRIDMTTDPYTISPFSSEAQAAGIRAGSDLLAVNGRPVEGGDDRAAVNRIAAALGGSDGQRLVLTMRAPDGSVSDHSVVRGPQHLAAADRAAPMSYPNRMRFYMVTGLAGALVMICGAILLFRRRASDPVVALLSVGLLGLPAGGAAALFADPVLYEAFVQVTSSISLICLMLAMSVFPAGEFTPRWTLFVIPLLLAAAIVDRIVDLPQVVGMALAFAILAAVLTAVGLRYRSLPAGPQRQQIKWAVLGFALFVMLAMTGMALSYFDRQVEDNAAHLVLLILTRLIQPLAFIVLVAGLLISLLRHRLYDADAAISRSALYGGMTLFLVAVFAAFGKLFETLGEEYFGDTAGTAAGAIAAGVAALLLVPLHNRLSRWSENRFQRDIARMRASLPELLVEMRDSADPDELAGDALRLIMSGVRAKHGVVLLPSELGGWRVSEAEGLAPEGLVERLSGLLPVDPASGLVRTDDPDLPVRLPLLAPSGILSGWIVLGPHPDGSLYGKDDREALKAVASPLGRALCLTMERKRLRSEGELRERQRYDALNQTVSQMQKQIERLFRLLGNKSGPVAG